MQMNATGFAISQSADGSGATMLGGPTYGMGAPGPPSLVYIYPTDPLGGYSGAAPLSGFSGVPAVTVSGTAGDGSAIGRQVTGAYAVKFTTYASAIATQ